MKLSLFELKTQAGWSDYTEAVAQMASAVGVVQWQNISFVTEALLQASKPANENPKSPQRSNVWEC